jgi:hypothetical protein
METNRNNKQRTETMKLSKWSEGIQKHKGKNYQSSSLMVSLTYVDCPHCATSQDTNITHDILKCENDKCKKDFYVGGLSW